MQRSDGVNVCGGALRASVVRRAEEWNGAASLPPTELLRLAACRSPCQHSSFSSVGASEFATDLRRSVDCSIANSGTNPDISPVLGCACSGGSGVPADERRRSAPVTTVLLSAGGNIILLANLRRHAKPWACSERQANCIRHPSSPTRFLSGSSETNQRSAARCRPRFITSKHHTSPLEFVLLRRRVPQSVITGEALL